MSAPPTAPRPPAGRPPGGARRPARSSCAPLATPRRHHRRATAATTSTASSGIPAGDHRSGSSTPRSTPPPRPPQVRDRRRRRPHPRHVRRHARSAWSTASVLFHYGLVTEVIGSGRGRRDGHRHRSGSPTPRCPASASGGPRSRGSAPTPSSTCRRRRARRCGSPRGEHRRRALFLDKMDEGEQLPDRPRHERRDRVHAVLVPQRRPGRPRRRSRASPGVATKTCYALFLLYMLFETDWGLEARDGSAHDRAAALLGQGRRPVPARQAQQRLRRHRPRRRRRPRSSGRRSACPTRGPFQRRRRVRPGRGRRRRTSSPIPDIAVRDKRETHAYGWSPTADDPSEGLLEFVFDDLESGPAVVHRAGRAHRAAALGPPARRRHHRPGRAVPSPTDTVGSQLGGRARGRCGQAGRSHRARTATVIETLDDLVDVRRRQGHRARRPPTTRRGPAASPPPPARRSSAGCGRPRPGCAGSSGPGSPRSTSPTRCRWSTCTPSTPTPSASSSPSVLAQVWAEHEDSTAPGRTFVVLDELNKYAPAPGRLAHQGAAGRHRRPRPQPRGHPHRRPAEPVGRRPRHHQQRRARGRRPDQGVASPPSSGSCRRRCGPGPRSSPPAR